MTRATRAIKILAFAGSARKDSYNKKLAAFAANTIKAADCAVTILDLHEFPLPLYDGDVEANSDYPQNAAKIKRMMKEHDGWLIASPEYNSSISGVLKNTIDWVSRSGNGEGDLSAFKGKISALVSASPGKLGGASRFGTFTRYFVKYWSLRHSKSTSHPHCSECF